MKINSVTSISQNSLPTTSFTGVRKSQKVANESLRMVKSFLKSCKAAEKFDKMWDMSGKPMYIGKGKKARINPEYRKALRRVTGFDVV